jgi:hypothetical protein
MEITSLKNALSRYLIYVVYFLGIGMVSSGIVLMPFNAARYGTILIIGLVLFSTGSFINEVVLEKKQLTLTQRIQLIVLSLTLAIGIGMISGGIAHFKESPTYVTYLIPLGIIISFVSFLIKHAFKLSKKEVLWTATLLLLVALSTHTGLTMAADAMNVTNDGGDIFKGHGM